MERLVLPCISVQNIHRQYVRIQYGCQDNDSRRIPVRAVITALVNLFESTEQLASLCDKNMKAGCLHRQTSSLIIDPCAIRDQAFPILKIFVPQVGHVPCVAGLLFFMVTTLVFFISFLVRHFIQ